MMSLHTSGESGSTKGDVAQNHTRRSHLVSKGVQERCKHGGFFFFLLLLFFPASSFLVFFLLSSFLFFPSSFLFSFDGFPPLVQGFLSFIKVQVTLPSMHAAASQSRPRKALGALPTYLSYLFTEETCRGRTLIFLWVFVLDTTRLFCKHFSIPVRIRVGQKISFSILLCPTTDFLRASFGLELFPRGKCWPRAMVYVVGCRVGSEVTESGHGGLKQARWYGPQAESERWTCSRRGVGRGSIGEVKVMNDGWRGLHGLVFMSREASTCWSGEGGEGMK